MDKNLGGPAETSHLKLPLVSATLQQEFSATPPEFGERPLLEFWKSFTRKYSAEDLDLSSWEQMFILPRFLRSILNDERWLVFLVMFILAAHVVGLVVIVLFY